MMKATKLLLLIVGALLMNECSVQDESESSYCNSASEESVSNTGTGVAGAIEPTIILLIQLHLDTEDLQEILI